MLSGDFLSIYHRTGFNCDVHNYVNCEFFYLYVKLYLKAGIIRATLI